MPINYQDAFESDGFQGVNLDRGINAVAVYTSTEGSPVIGVDVLVTVGQDTPVTRTTDENGWILIAAPLATLIVYNFPGTVCYLSGETTVTTSTNSAHTSYTPINLELVEDFPCFSVVPVNSFNFYRWHSTQGLSFPLVSNIQSCFCLLNDNDCANVAEIIVPVFSDQYRRGGGGSKFSFVQQISQRRCSFYINHTVPTLVPGFNELSLVLTDGKNIIAADIGTLNQDFVDNENYNFWADFDFPNVPNGEYQFAIVRNDVEVVYIGNPLEVVSNLVEVSQIRYRNATDIYNFQYSNLPEFQTTAYLRLTVVSTQYEDDEEIYKEVSTQKHLSYKAQADRVYGFETYWFDQNQHEAMAIAGKHDQLTLNGVLLQRTGAYQQDVTKGGNLSKGMINFYDQAFAEANNNC